LRDRSTCGYPPKSAFRVVPLRTWHHSAPTPTIDLSTIVTLCRAPSAALTPCFNSPPSHFDGGRATSAAPLAEGEQSCKCEQAARVHAGHFVNAEKVFGRKPQAAPNGDHGVNRRQGRSKCATRRCVVGHRKTLSRSRLAGIGWTCCRFRRCDETVCSNGWRTDGTGLEWILDFASSGIARRL